MREDTIKLPDGRTLSFAEYGNREGPPVFVCHGTPGCRLDLAEDDPLVADTGARIIIPDRPGFGHSSPMPTRTLSDWGRDIAHLADALGIERYVVAGGSGGGPHALACAHERPDRVQGCLVFASPAPSDFPGATAGMSFGNRLGLKLSTRGGWLYRKLLVMQSKSFLQSPDRTIKAMMRAVDPTDAALLAKPETATAITRSMTEAYRQGVDAHVVDGKLSLTLAPWSFRLEDIRVPVHIWHGEQDRLVSLAMGQRLAGLIPGARLTVLPNVGHFVMDYPEHVADFTNRLRELTETPLQ